MASDTQRLFDKLDELRSELVGVRLESRETKVKVAALELGVTEAQHTLTQRLNDVETLINACWSNTTFAGVENSPTDGACTAASGGTCSSGKCTSGLRKGIACGSDADCNYCSGGAIGKLGRKCADADDCGYYRCAF